MLYEELGRVKGKERKLVDIVEVKGEEVRKDIDEII